MKRAILAAVLLFSMVASLSSSSSGISKDQYNKVSNDLATAQAQIQTLQAQVTSLQSDLQTANAKISKAKALADIVDSIMKVYSNAGTMTTAQLAASYVQWSNGIQAIGIPC